MVAQRGPTPRALTSLIWASVLASAAHALSAAGIYQTEADARLRGGRKTHGDYRKAALDSSGTHTRGGFERRGKGQERGKVRSTPSPRVLPPRRAALTVNASMTSL